MNKHQVKTGESLWLIEQTDPSGIRKFWAGDIWTADALDAVRFTNYSAAATLACHYAWSSFGHPPRKNEHVDICEHLFQCGIIDLERQTNREQEAAVLKIAKKDEK